MRSIVEAIIRERMFATLAVVTIAVPGFFWVGAGAASLVLLRKGAVTALQISLLGLIVAVISWYFARPMPLLTLIGALVLAQVLRTTVSWVKTLLASVVLGLFCYGMLYLFPTIEMQIISKNISIEMPAILKMLQESYNITVEQSKQVSNVTPLVVPIIYAFGAQVFSIISVLVARNLQSLLYNPGGFKEEFYQLRMPLNVSIILGVCIFLVSGLNYTLTVLLFVCSTPLIFTGLAVIHAFFAKAKSIPFGLILFYVISVFVFYIVYPLLVILALVDSVFNLRKLPSLNSKSSDS